MPSETEREARERRLRASCLYGWGPELPGHSASRGQHKAARNFLAGAKYEAPIARQAERAATLRLLKSKEATARAMLEEADPGEDDHITLTGIVAILMDTIRIIEAGAHTEEE